MDTLPKAKRTKKADKKPSALSLLALEGVLVKCLGPDTVPEHWFRNDGTRGNRTCKECRKKQTAMNLSPLGADPVRVSDPGEPTRRWRG